MTRFTNWKSNEKEFVLQHVVKTPLDSSYMCKKCKLEAKRYHDTHHHVPKVEEAFLSYSQTDLEMYTSTMYGYREADSRFI